MGSYVKFNYEHEKSDSTFQFLDENFHNVERISSVPYLITVFCERIKIEIRKLLWRDVTMPVSIFVFPDPS